MDQRTNIQASIFVFIFGLALMVYGYFLYQKDEESLSWPFTDGEITSSKIGEEHVDGGKTIYYPKIKYKYFVNESEYVGYRIALGKIFAAYPVASNAVGFYEVGNSVRVHYNPDSPGDSVLEVGPQASAVLIPGLGLVLAICSLCFVLYVFSNKDS